MTDDQVKILNGTTFMVSDGSGDVSCSPASPMGLFAFDTRFLSRWQLTVNGQPLAPLSVDDLQYFETRFFLVPGPPTQYVDAKLSVLRQRSIVTDLSERLTLINHDQVPIDLTIRMEVGSDFADVFEIRGEAVKKGQYYTRVEDSHLCMGYRRDQFRRETLVICEDGAEMDDRGFTWRVTLAAQQEWSAAVQVKMSVLDGHGKDVRKALAVGRLTRQDLESDLAAWLDRAPKLTTDWEPLPGTYHRSLVDLAALRYRTLSYPNSTLPAAGLPWFMALVGRDSIITCLQTLPFASQLTTATLRMLSAFQGTQLDDFRDEEPGKILREFRYGESAAFNEMPHSPYYGNADGTPLFVILLDEYERWTGDDRLVRDYEQEVRTALHWIDEYGDLLGDGYVRYQPRNQTTGVVNQVWKESIDAICFRDGRLPAMPRATCEVQGYAYDAKMRGARLAREFWDDPEYADRLEREAAELRDRFNRDFWVEDGQYYALALDSAGSQVDALASNMGHLLWSGIVPQHRAAHVVRHLLGPELYSGWGVRTLATDQARYNPIGYHVGAVWPWDNALIALGLRRYGFHREAWTIAEGMLEAAQMFGGRLPEAFGGYERELTKYPVEYPTASSPQAWSTGAPLMLLRAILGLEPHVDHLAVTPALPEKVGRIELLNIRGRWGVADAFGHGRPPYRPQS
ncbi:amylo-alpha-1,6-glucosidase [Rhizomonospora bruguierae]|uniref:amylo-alpha-1,6-glucosidase n=1 Tax=Rhizomonospora bruguierae TaxID=1581705 RepID=UPI001BCFD0B5|nr:glycogen debranching N-terminal domain-containing protein [Micromonospora sp. NBRC 107566]